MLNVWGEKIEEVSPSISNILLPLNSFLMIGKGDFKRGLIWANIL